MHFPPSSGVVPAWQVSQTFASTTVNFSDSPTLSRLHLIVSPSSEQYLLSLPPFSAITMPATTLLLLLLLLPPLNSPPRTPSVVERRTRLAVASSAPFSLWKEGDGVRGGCEGGR